jgi:hypothetical protein
MKRGAPLKRSTPLKQGGKEMKRSPMSRGASTLKTTAPLARAAGPMKARSKTNSTPRPKTGEAELCRGQPCYLQVPGVHAHPVDTVVPCHSNQARHGKGKGIKAHDKYTVPGCMHCHAEIDQGNRFTREEKFSIWDNAYARWEPVRDAMR